jgi:ABC-type transport system involved in multi-copper enzyme maturation permease subunit
MNINPVLMKELKVRMRGWRAAGIIALYLVVLSLVAVFIIYSTFVDPYGSTIDPQISTGAYTGLAVIQFILIMFIVPALTAGAISGEREKQTLDLVLCTRLKPISIVTGKLFASTSQTLLLIVSSLPLFSMVFLFGGISMKEVLQLFAFYIITAITIGSIGIFFSTCLKRTTAATVLTYGMVAFLCIGTIFLGMFYLKIFYNWDYDRFLPIFYTNPVGGFGSLLASQFGYDSGGLGFIFGMNVGNTANGAKAIEPWLGNVIFDVIFSALMLTLSAMRINPTREGIFSKKKM